MSTAPFARLLSSVLFFGAVISSAGQTTSVEQAGDAASNIQWLEQRSMLFQARRQAQRLSGNGKQWQHAYGDPQPREAVKTASVWLLNYPGSVITRPGKSVLATWGEDDLWQALEHIGIDLLHTGPIKQ